MPSAVENFVRHTLRDLPPSIRENTLSKFANHYITRLADIKGISDAQYTHMGVPIGIATRLKRALEMKKTVEVDVSPPGTPRTAPSSPPRSAPSSPRGTRPLNSKFPSARTRPLSIARSLGRIEILQDWYECSKGQVFDVRSRVYGNRPADACWLLNVDGYSHVTVPCNHEDKGWRWIVKQEMEVSALFPYVQKSVEFLRGAQLVLKEKVIPWGDQFSEIDIVRIPVSCLRWMQTGMKAKLHFAHSVLNSEHSVLKLFSELLSGERSIDSIEPLDVVMQDVGCEVQLFAKSSHRLLSLLMLQAAQRDKAICVKCVMRTADSNFADTFKTPSAGLSLGSGSEGSSQLLQPLYQHELATSKAIGEITMRHPAVTSVKEFSPQQRKEPPLLSFLVDSAPVALLITPPPTPGKPKRQLWIFQGGAWIEAPSPSSSRDTFQKLEVRDPARPWHLDIYWQSMPCVTSVIGSEIVMVTDNDIHRIYIGFGEQLPNRIVDQALPHALSPSSRLAILRDNRLFLVSLPATKVEQPYLVAHTLNFNSKSWDPFRFIVSAEENQNTSEQGIEVRERVFFWKDATELPTARDFDMVEHVGSYVYFACCADHLSGKSWLQRASVSTGKLEVFACRRPENTDWQPYGWSLHCKKMKSLGHSGTERDSDYETYQLQHSLVKCKYDVHDAKVFSTLQTELTSGSALVLNGNLYTLHLQAVSILARQSKELQEHHVDEIALQRRDALLPTLAAIPGEHTLDIVLGLMCLSQPGFPTHKMGTVKHVELPSDCCTQSEECQVHSDVSSQTSIIAIPLADRSDKEALYVFVHDLRESNGMFQAGWCMSLDGTARRLETTALRLPMGFSLDFLTRNLQVDFVGGRSVALLSAPNASAQFDAIKEIWSSVPPTPIAGRIGESINAFLVASKRRGVLWNVDLDYLSPCVAEHTSFLCSEIKRREFTL
eukprot:TRINITY_DN20271_c0_g5_i1.p1 TRINITY_DN20271_c0_g5~~TRINITY_DN20271_c0_g5_i1.p1  ORF type:complete len:944 (+),score=95.78 TRINITY_DN20271_c0_g5_i1:50-2881(+)